MIPLALANVIVTAVLRYWLSGHHPASPTAWLGGY
jgi:hypothetical protein